jgi:WD40 repeat protein
MDKDDALGLRPLIPDHDLISCIGKGSYGTVWLARTRMGMYRAVKVVQRKSFEHERPFERELSGIRKFEPVSRSHEGFIDVLHVGINEQEGYFYYVMELGDDVSSGQQIDPARYQPATLSWEIKRHGRVEPQQCLKFGLALADALAELHKYGLVHRDIKPSNIIFVNGAPKLADIGLVADMDEARSYVGTEGFIPPEGPGTPQADIYSLGKVLYEAMTGRDRQAFPELPTECDSGPDPEVFQELNEIVLRACHQQAKERYHSAEDLHADLVLIANGKSVKRLRLLEQRLRNIKRTAGVLAAVIAVVGGIAYHFYRELRIQGEAHERDVGSSVAYGNNAMEKGDLIGSLPHFTRALQLDQENPERKKLDQLRVGSVLERCPTLTALWFTGERVNTAEFSPDGKRALIVHHFTEAEIRDVATGEVIGSPFGSEYELVRGAFSPDGRMIAAGGGKGFLTLWDAETHTNLAAFEHSDEVVNARFNPAGDRVVSSCLDGAARVWDVKEERLVFSIRPGKNSVRFAAYSPDGKKIVVTSYDGFASLWDAQTGQLLHGGMSHGGWATYAGFSPDGRRLVTACDDRRAHVWSAEGERILPPLNHADYVWSAEFSPDGQWILTGCLDKTVRFWSAETLEPAATGHILPHSDRVTQATFSADGRRIITACVDGTVRIWDLGGVAVTPQPVHVVWSPDRSRFLTVTNQHLEARETLSGRLLWKPMPVGAGLREAAFNENGRYFALGFETNGQPPAVARTVAVFDAASGASMGPPLPITNQLERLVLGLDGKTVVAFHRTNAMVWSVERGVITATLPHVQIVRGATFAPSGDFLATRGASTVTIWNLRTGEKQFPTLTNAMPLTDVQFASDGSRFLTCGADKAFTRCAARCWSTGDGRPHGPPLMHGDGVLCGAFSPDGTRIVTGGEDSVAIVWESGTGRQLHVLPHNEQVRAVAFSPDGKLILTGSADNTARVWNAETGDPITPFLQHPDQPVVIRMLADGQTLVSSTTNGVTAWVWRLPSEKMPPNDLSLLARLLDAAGGAASPAGASTASPESLSVIWNDLHSKYPAMFQVSTNKIAAWYRWQAERSEAHSNQFAAVFNWNQLRHLQPAGTAATQSVDHALSKLNAKRPSAAAQ